MTVEELSKKINVSENRIVRHWPEVCKSAEKRGIVLVKRGKGKIAQYGILEDDELEVRF